MPRPDTLLPPDSPMPSGGPTVRLSTPAMACEFSVIMNPGASERIDAVTSALETVHDTERWLSVYRSDSEISRVNALAADGPVAIRADFLHLLQLAQSLTQQTDGAFDIASGQLTRLWKACRREQQLPDDDAIAEALRQSGSDGLELRVETSEVRFRRPGLLLDPGGIGKGLALDAAANGLRDRPEAPREYLMHGGHSSLLARGGHFGHRGWPVGIGNPLFTNQRLATIVLQNGAMSTSGSNIQFFRHNGIRYGHLLDPRTGRPIDGMLSVTVFAESAAVSDALSTAFFVLGPEKARVCCEKLPGVGAILIPFPAAGRTLDPVIVGTIPGTIVWDNRQIRHPAS